MPLIEASRMWKEYSQAGEKVIALRDIELSIDPGEFVVVTGESGSGKTTLLAVLSTLESPTRGSVRFLGETVDSLPAARLDEIRRNHIGFMFQDFLLVSHLSALENVLLPGVFAPGRGTAEEAEALLERFRVAHKRRQRPGSLSRGEMQRIALARALINRPRVLFADEPTANLDRAHALAIWTFLGDLNRDQGLTVVAATHDPFLAGGATRIVRLDDGVLATDEKIR